MKNPPNKNRKTSLTPRHLSLSVCINSAPLQPHYLGLPSLLLSSVSVSSGLYYLSLPLPALLQCQVDPVKHLFLKKLAP